MLSKVVRDAVQHVFAVVQLKPLAKSLHREVVLVGFQVRSTERIVCLHVLWKLDHRSLQDRYRLLGLMQREISRSQPEKSVSVLRRYRDTLYEQIFFQFVFLFGVQHPGHIQIREMIIRSKLQVFSKCSLCVRILPRVHVGAPQLSPSLGIFRVCLHR